MQALELDLDDDDDDAVIIVEIIVGVAMHVISTTRSTRRNIVVMLDGRKIGDIGIIADNILILDISILIGATLSALCVRPQCRASYARSDRPETEPAARGCSGKLENAPIYRYQEPLRILPAHNPVFLGHLKDSVRVECLGVDPNYVCCGRVDSHSLCLSDREKFLNVDSGSRLQNCFPSCLLDSWRNGADTVDYVQ
jgi:hypothetical protein